MVLTKYLVTYILFKIKSCIIAIICEPGGN